MLEKEVVKNLQKYKIFSIKSAILKDDTDTVVLDIPIKI